MLGSVYQLKLAHYDGGQPHPHVVVLAFSGNRNCIVVPGYSHDGFMVNEYVSAMKKRGYREDRIFVELDNAVHVKFIPGFTGKVARWCPSPIRRVSIKALSAGTLVGQMDEDGLLKIVQCFLDAGDLVIDTLSPSAIKQLNRVAKDLKASIDARQNPP